MDCLCESSALRPRAWYGFALKRLSTNSSSYELRHKTSKGTSRFVTIRNRTASVRFASIRYYTDWDASLIKVCLISVCYKFGTSLLLCFCPVVLPYGLRTTWLEFRLVTVHVSHWEVSQLGYWYPDMYLSDQRSRREALSFTKSIPVPLQSVQRRGLFSASLLTQSASVASADKAHL
jgi:hypothetical protein